MKLHHKLFPDMPANWEKINLNHEANLCFRYADFPNPLLDVNYFRNWLEHIHDRRNTLYSYGGYGEDRSLLWRGHYMHPDAMIHLGVDYNVESNTLVHMPCDGKVIKSWVDTDQYGGWGGQVICSLTNYDFFLVFGHLHPWDLPNVKKKVKAGDVIGVVAPHVNNGGWYPHLHLQCISKNISLDSFDGYGSLEDLKNCPNPEEVLIV